MSSLYVLKDCSLKGLMNKGVLFYQKQCNNQEGESLSDIWKYDHHEYEGGHHFIQWLFPSDEPSSVSPYAPLVDEDFRQDFQRSPKLKLRLKRSYEQFLNFMGLIIDPQGDLSIHDRGVFYLRVQRPNHNLQRITRVLRSLNLLGLRSYALKLYNFLMQHSADINDITLQYWHKANYCVA